MAFEPKPGDRIKVANEVIEFLPIEDSSFIYAEAGKEGTIYKVLKDKEYYALKVFYPEYQDDRLLQNTEKLSQIKNITGFRVADRTVINRTLHRELIKEIPELNYSILMPWIQGTVWGNLTTGEHSIPNEKYSRIAKLFLEAVYKLEVQGMAHCDLSNNNFIIDPKCNSVELIDIEDMYAPGMPRPIPDISYGTPGYRTKYIAEKGLWGPNSDRFASAILSAEIFTWHNERIRKNKAGDMSFFDETEIGEDCERYHLMRYFLEAESPQLASLFEKAWFARYLDQCPKIEEWMRAVGDARTPAIVNEEAFVSNLKNPEKLNEGKTFAKENFVINGIPPKMRINQTLLDFGEFNEGKKELQLIIENIGGSALEGVLISAEWLTPSQKSFSIKVGDKRKITIAISKNAPKPQKGFEQRIPNALIIESNAGVEVVGARYQFAKPPFYQSWFNLLIVVMILFGGIWYGTTSDDRLFNRAEKNFQSGNTDLAIQLMNQLLEKYPSERELVQETYLRWGGQLSEAEQYQESNAILLEGEKILKNGDVIINYQNLYQNNYLELAKNEYKNNDLDKGVFYLEKAKAHDPENKNGDINTMYDDFYIAYAKEAYSNQSYEESIAFLENVSLSRSESKDEEIKKLYQDIYLSWVDSLIKTKDYEEGGSVLERAKKYFTNTTDQTEWNNKSISLNISWANSLSSSGKYIEALEKINQIKKNGLNNQQINKINQAGSSILRTFSNSTGSQANKEITSLVKGICGSQHSANPLYPIFSINSTLKTYVIYNLTSLKVSHSATPSSIYYVACVTDKEPILVENCRYEGGYSILRYRRSWEIALYNILNGEKINETQLRGMSPPECQYTESFTRGIYKNDRYLEEAKDASILTEWIMQYMEK